MEDVEIFFATWRNTAWAFFSLAAFILLMAKLFFMAKALYDEHLEKLMQESRLDQRQEWQAQYFDVGEDRFDKMLDRYIQCKDDFHRLEKAMIQHEIDCLKD